MAAREAGRVALSVARRSDHREPPRGAPDPCRHADCSRAGMKRSCLLPLALLSGLLLSACGARSSLTEPGASDECGPWVVHDGAAGTVLFAYSHSFAVLDDGSVVVPMAEGPPDADGGAGTPWKRRWLRKIDPDGAIAWEARGEPEGVSFTAAARDAAGGIYVAGFAEPGAPSVLGAAVTCAGKGTCSFVAKLTQTGEPVWVKAFPSSAAADRAFLTNLAVMDDGRITLGGAFDGTLDLGCGPASVTAGGDDANLFIARLSPSGECLWSRAIVGLPLLFPGADSMAVGDAGDIALALSLIKGPPGPSIDFGGGPVPTSSESGPPFAVAKYASDGALVFAKVATSGSTRGSPNVAVTGAGEVLLSASYQGTIDLGGGPRGSVADNRQFVTKFGATGEELWTHDIAADPVGGGSSLIAIEPGGSFFLAGLGSPGMAILGEPVPERAPFVAAFDAGGKPIDVQTFPLTRKVRGFGLSASAAGALVLVGEFEGVLDLGQGPLVSEGRRDAFVARICR